MKPPEVVKIEFTREWVQKAETDFRTAEKIQGGAMKKRKRSAPLLAYQAEEALRKAVAEAIAEHRRNGIPIAIWRDGKVVRIPADQIEVREPQIEYTVSPKKRK